MVVVQVRQTTEVQQAQRLSEEPLDELQDKDATIFSVSLLRNNNPVAKQSHFLLTKDLLRYFRETPMDLSRNGP